MSEISNNTKIDKGEVENGDNNASGRINLDQEEVPFNFKQFQEQIRHQSALKITKYVKNFEIEFERHPRTINEQIKFVRDFLDFINRKMHECEIWKDVSEKEFENAKEGMEKLLMMRLYKLIFTPAIKGQAVTDDLERDEILHQKIQIFRWVGEKHLDIPITPHNEIFLNHAKNELLKMRQFIAPRDKLICILNCCKVIYGLIKFVDGEEGADKFLPILIFVILKANPEHLMSNVQYIYRFRNPEKLQSEAGYYLSSLMSAVAFIENMDVNSLTITQDEFDSNIELTVKELAEETPKLPENTKEISYDNAINPSKPIVANNNNNRLSLINPAQLLNPAQAKALFEKGSYYAQRTIQTPINMVGKLFSEINTGVDNNNDGTIVNDNNGSSNSSNNGDVNSIEKSDDSGEKKNSLLDNDDEETNLQQIEISSLIDESSSSLSSSSPPQNDTNADNYIHLQQEQLMQQLKLKRQRELEEEDNNLVDELIARSREKEMKESLKLLKSIFSHLEPELCEEVYYAKDYNMNSAANQLLEISNSSIIIENEYGNADAVHFIGMNHEPLNHA